MSDLPARLVTGFLLAPFVVAALWVGGLWFLLLLGGVGLAMIWEWGRLIDDVDLPLLTALYVVTLLGVGAVLWQQFQFDWRSLSIIAVASGGAFLLALIRGQNRFLAPLGLAYLLLPLVLLADLRSDEEMGAIALLIFIFMVWGSDIGAYFTGRLIGGRRLVPAISAHKTWSGMVGGFVFSMVLGGVASYLLSLSYALILWGLVLSLATQLGDLLESYMKRSYDLKDMSQILPGHGGVLDRVDGLLISVFVFYLILFFMGWPGVSASTIFLRG